VNSQNPELEELLITKAVCLPFECLDLVVGPSLGPEDMGWSYHARIPVRYMAMEWTRKHSAKGTPT
jgi:hypothetical protein